jgi:UDP-4-amino-4,6-dideoxy-N-acetyl-beta-L-altrosamine transaminase/dTDP-4-dehydrorhamnose reductase
MEKRVQKKRLLITGASGLLGSNLAYCLRDNYDICGLYHAHEIRMDKVATRPCDLRVKSEAREIMGEFLPDIVIHCAAQVNVDACEEDPGQAEQLNVETTKNVVDALPAAGSKLIYISTDLVYDGVKGDFLEDDSVGPLNIYARSKISGEKEALKVPGALVLRTNFFGWNINKKESLGEWVISGLSARRTIKGFTDAKTSSIYTFDLAELMDRAIRKDLSGIYNLGSSSSLSKHDFAVAIAHKLNFDAGLVIPVSIDHFNFRAKRSKNLSLNVNKLSRSLEIAIPSLEESIDRFIHDYRNGIPRVIKSYHNHADTYPKLDYLPYGRQSIDDNDIQAVVEVLRSGNLTQGPKIKEFEQKICDVTGADYAVAVNSGTSALHIACLAAGIGPGDEVITSPNSFVASANCAVYCGGKPCFADIDPRTYDISPREIERKITGKTKAVIPVHFAGQSCDMEAIKNIVAKKEKEFGHKIYIIEDGAHALGSRYKGHAVGSCHYSDMTVMSFHPVKHITTGEGGIVLTNDKSLWQSLCRFRSHGITNCPEEFLNRDQAFPQEGAAPYSWYYEQQTLGYNYRTTDIQCALGISQLRRLPEFTKRRREIVDYYNRQFKNLAWVQVPFESPDCENNFHLYVLLFDFAKTGKTRSWCMDELWQQGIRTQVHYIPIVLQPFYTKEFGTDINSYPHVKSYYQRCLSIPLYPGMTDGEVARVVDCVKGLSP